MVATFVLWFALAVALWFPFWSQLRHMRMYTHDVEMTYLIVLGPPIVGVTFIVATVAALIVARSCGSRRRDTLARAILFLPGVATFLNLNPLRDLTWHYPLAEASVLAIGAALGWLLIRRRALQGVR
jgi:hypothetical protein